jgi:hypothetical protein
MIIYSLSTLYRRKENLDIILPNILDQCDLLFLNLVGFEDKIPVENKKIKINYHAVAGSEIRFFNYNDVPDDSYYFTIDDDISYPYNYTEEMVKNMIKYNNKSMCCVHGSNIDKKLNSKFYKKNRQVFHFKDELIEDTEVMIPGVGTSCFYKKNMKLNISDYKTKNMSDTYTACFLAEQKVKRVSVKRPINWLIPLDEHGVRIYGNNPYEEIDNMINRFKDKL